MLLVQIWQLLTRERVVLPKLVLVGKRHQHCSDLFSQLELMNYPSETAIVFEELTDKELVTLYRHCLFTMYPSFTEGWGLPIGESLCYGKLCVASQDTSLPEVGGDFVLYIDPHNVRSAADVVRRLLTDRSKLRQYETRIRQEFQPRTWEDHREQFIAAVRELGHAKGPATRAKPITCPFGKLVRPFRLPQAGWRYGSEFPPRQVVADAALPRLLLSQGWHPMKSWGTWMDGRFGRIGFNSKARPGDSVRVVLLLRAAAWARGNCLRVRAGCGASKTVAVPRSDTTVEVWPHFLVWMDCVADKASRVELELEVIGEIPPAYWGETRNLCVGLLGLLCLPVDRAQDRIPPNELIRPTALTGRTGEVIVPCGREVLLEALRRRIILVDGWCEPEAWGTWMDGASARLGLTVEAAPGDSVRVVLQLRVPRGRRTRVTARSDCGASTKAQLSEHDPCDFSIWINCRVGRNGGLGVRLEAVSESNSSTWDPQCPILGITGLAYGRQGSMAEQLALTEALLFPVPADDGEIARKALDAGLRFLVTGHMNGTYSLAVVNRRLALALEDMRPGTVRVDQVEEQPVRNLSQLPQSERENITALAARRPHQEGPEVVITQHWPVYVPYYPGDLSLAWIPWEESLVPLDMVRQVNSNFQGILVQTRFVAKALINSGIRLPVRLMGCALDLGPFASLGARRAAPLERGRPNKTQPFTFLHVSSCFPRKGVDALLAAYAKTFRHSDPVRLVIKGFPNPHNDVPEQILRLRILDPEAPEIEMINGDLSEEAVLELYAAADAVVLPTRGEGFNMPAAEALAAGLPLIVTGSGGQRDFAGPDVARQVDYRFARSRSHLQTYSSVWADPDIDDLAAALREVFDATGDAEAGSEIAARVERGRRAAERVGDASVWASRVREIALDFLSSRERPVASKVAWVSTWNVRCGIATHSRYLLDHFPNAERDVTVLCEERTQPSDLVAPGGPTARVAWKINDAASMDRLAEEIEMIGARVVVLQHQPGLIQWNDLPSLLLDARLRGRLVVITLHNVLQLVGLQDRDRIIGALAGVSRILVHNVRDLNLLKSCGLIDNVTLFPHGSLPPNVRRPPARDLSKSAAPTIGTYGFFLPPKGLDVLIEAFAEIRREWPAATLRMVTAEYPSEDSRAELLRCRLLAKAFVLGNAVEWHTDYLTDEESLALLAPCDLLVMPYRETPESASGAARVAMASRVPLAVTPLTIFEEMGNGVIVLDGMDSASVAKGVARALRDQELREHTVDQADKWLEAHDWARMSERLCGMILGLLANSDPDRIRNGTPS